MVTLSSWTTSWSTNHHKTNKSKHLNTNLSWKSLAWYCTSYHVFVWYHLEESTQLQFPSKNGNEGNKSLHKRSFRSCLPSWIFPGVSVLRSGQILKEGFLYLFSFLKFAVYQGLGLRLFLKMRNGVVFRLPHHFPVRTMAQLLNSDWNSDRNISKAWTIWKVMGRALAKCKKILI